MDVIIANTQKELCYSNMSSLEGSTITNINFDGDICILTIKQSNGRFIEIQLRKNASQPYTKELNL